MRSTRIVRLGIVAASVALAGSLVVGCNDDTTTGTEGKSSSGSSSTKSTTAQLPAWKLPNGVKIVKTFSGDNKDDDDASEFTMSAATTAFAWRYTCTGQATDDKLNGQYLGMYVSGTGSSVSLIDNAAWHKSGAGYTPTGTLFSVNTGEEVHIKVAGKCAFELGQITSPNPPTDPILQTP